MKTEEELIWESYTLKDNQNKTHLLEKTPEKNLNVPQIIRKLVKKYNMTPKEINNGNCDEFAYDLLKIVGGSIYETDFDSEYSGHFFIKHKNKYYDAEHLFAVNAWQQLFINI